MADDLPPVIPAYPICPGCARQFVVDANQVPDLPEALMWMCPSCAVQLVIWRQDGTFRASRIKLHEPVPRRPS